MRLPDVRPLAEHPVVRDAELDAEEGCAEEEQQGDHSRGDGDRPPHHEDGDAVPDAFAVDDRATLEHAALVDPVTERREHRGEQHHGTERRRGGNPDSGVPERPHERHREQEHGGEPDPDREGAEQDRPAGRPDRPPDGGPGVVAGRKLLAVARDDEQAVVDGEPETQAPSWR